MLVLADLPMHLGAFHGVGTNSIVMNRALLDRIVKGGNSRIQVNSFVYSILLHEYLHSLGLIEEADVRSLVRDISLKTFGNDHPASKIATAGPWSMLPKTWSSDQVESNDTLQPPLRDGTDQRFRSFTFQIHQLRTIRLFDTPGIAAFRASEPLHRSFLPHSRMLTRNQPKTVKCLLIATTRAYFSDFPILQFRRI